MPFFKEYGSESCFRSRVEVEYLLCSSVAADHVIRISAVERSSITTSLSEESQEGRDSGPVDIHSL